MSAWSYFFTIVIFWTSVSFAEVWSHAPEKNWDESWEQTYSEWVAHDLDTQWLQNPRTPFFKWKVDCADLVYLTRIYFSYVNQLEFKIHDPVKGRDSFLSSRSNRWDQIPKAEDRMRAFAKYVLSETNTRTLIDDTTLTKVSLGNIRPGIIVLGDRRRQHAQLLKSLRPSGVPSLIFATLPESEYLYESFVFPTSESAFPSGRVPSELDGGLRRWIWPQDLAKPTSQLSYHDEEQSKFKYGDFFETVMARLRIQERNPSEHFQYLMDEACMKTRVRVNVIIDAGHALLKLQGRPFTAAEKDLYSTDNRDRDIRLTFQKLDQFYLFNRSQIGGLALKQYLSILDPQMNSEDYCWVQWADNRVEPLGVLRQRFLDFRVSSNPYASFSQRWGE